MPEVKSASVDEIPRDPETNERRHDPFGPSSLERRFECAGSFAQEDGIPPLPAGDDAKAGSELHTRIAAALELGVLDMDLDDEDRELVDRCLAYANQTQENFDRDCVPEWQPEDKIVYRIEEPLAIRLDGKLRWGTCDYLIVYEYGGSKFGLLFDWKTGWKFPRDNALLLQLGAYALMASATFGLDRIEAHCYNPRLEESANFELDAEGLRQVAERWSVLVIMAESATVTTEGPWCQYCSAIGLCPSTEGKAYELEKSFGADRAPLRRGPTKAATAARIKEAAKSLSTERVAELLEQAEFAALIRDALRSRASEALREDPKALPGYKLVEVERRSIPAPFRLSAQLGEYGPGIAKLMESAAVPLKVFEDAFASKWTEEHGDGRGAKKAAKAAFEEKAGSAIKTTTHTQLRRTGR